MRHQHSSFSLCACIRGCVPCVLWVFCERQFCSYCVQKTLTRKRPAKHLRNTWSPTCESSALSGSSSNKISREVSSRTYSEFEISWELSACSIEYTARARLTEEEKEKERICQSFTNYVSATDVGMRIRGEYACVRNELWTQYVPLCCCPPLSLTPFSPITVLSPCVSREKSVRSAQHSTTWSYRSCRGKDNI